MPWKTGDVDGFIKDLTAEGKKVWCEVANSTLADCIKKPGGSEQKCAPRAVRIANKVAGKYRESAVGTVGRGHPELFQIARVLKTKEGKAMERMIERTLKGLVEIGRTISAANEAKLKAALGQIQEILKALDGGAVVTEAQRFAVNEANALIEAALSFDDIRTRVRGALTAKLNAKSLYIRDIYPDSVIYEGLDGFGNYTGKLFQVSYSMDDAGAVTFTSDPAEVEPKMTYETVTATSEAAGVVKTNKPNPTDDTLLKIGEGEDQEFVALIESKTKKGLIPIKIIQPGWGTSGFYSPEVLKAAEGKYKVGTHMHWDHPTAQEDAARPERSLTTLAAVIAAPATFEAAGVDGPGIYSYAKPFSGFETAIKEMASNIGLSHRALGKASKGEVEGKKGNIIESIDVVQSVDFVTKPGAGGEILQMFEAAGRNAGEQLTLSEAEKQQREVKRMELQQQLDESKKANEKLMAEKIARETVDLVSKQVNESKLPAPSKVRLIAVLSKSPALNEKGEINAEEMAKAVTAAITAEEKYISEVSGKKPGIKLGESQTDAPVIEGEGVDTEATHKALVESFTQTFLGQGKSLDEAKQMAEIAANG